MNEYKGTNNAHLHFEGSKKELQEINDFTCTQNTCDFTAAIFCKRFFRRVLIAFKSSDMSLEYEGNDE